MEERCIVTIEYDKMFQRKGSDLEYYLTSWYHGTETNNNACRI